MRETWIASGKFLLSLFQVWTLSCETVHVSLFMMVQSGGSKIEAKKTREEGHKKQSQSSEIVKRSFSLELVFCMVDPIVQEMRDG